MRQSLLVLVLPWLAVSCFHPDLDQAHYACDTITDCPPDFSCLKGTCQKGVAPPPADLLAPVTDLSQMDLAQAQDLSASGDLHISGCVSDGGSVSMGSEIFACRGLFGAGNGDSLCSRGYHVCTTDDAMHLQQLLPALCNTLGGFFASAIPASVNVGKLLCSSLGSTKALVGCGSESGSNTANDPCDSLDSYISCSGGNNNWSCNKGFSDAAHVRGRGGVLCCQ